MASLARRARRSSSAAANLSAYAVYACFCPVAGGAAAGAAAGAGEEKGALAVPARPAAGPGVGGLGRGMATCTRYSAAQWKRSRLSVVQPTTAAAAAPWSWAGLVVRLSGLPGEDAEEEEEEEEEEEVLVGAYGGSGLWRCRMCGYSGVGWADVRRPCTQGASQKREVDESELAGACGSEGGMYRPWRVMARCSRDGQTKLRPRTPGQFSRTCKTEWEGENGDGYHMHVVVVMCERWYEVS